MYRIAKVSIQPIYHDSIQSPTNMEANQVCIHRFWQLQLSYFIDPFINNKIDITHETEHIYST